MVIYKYTEEEMKNKGEIKMLNDEICKLRDKLNKSIEDGEDYDVILKISVELDELIAEYYKGKKQDLEKAGELVKEKSW